MTAYVREVVKSAGAPADFSGPMAKPHRMFWMTVFALVSIFDPQIGAPVAALLDWVLEEPARNDRERLLAHVRDRLAAADESE